MGIFDGSAGFQYRFAYLSAKEVLAKSIEIRAAGQRAAHRYDWKQADHELGDLLKTFGTNFNPVAEQIRTFRGPRGVVRCGLNDKSAHDLVERLARETHGATGFLANAKNTATKKFQLSTFKHHPSGLSLLSAGEIAELKADLIEEAEGAASSAPKPKVEVKLANNARDKWLYEQLCKVEVPQSAVMRQLNTQCVKRHWRKIIDINAAKQAANRWALRNDKPPIPRRQSGRTSKRSKQRPVS